METKLFVEAHWPKKDKTTIFNVMAMGEYYFLKTNQHVFNESLYVSKGRIGELSHSCDGVYPSRDGRGRHR
jgi:hypothetical protein